MLLTPSDGRPSATFTKKMLSSEKMWITKHVIQFVATGTNMVRRNEWNNSRCLRCGQFGEDSRHAVTCKNTTAYDTFSDKVLKLQENLQKIDTHPILSRQSYWVYQVVRRYTFAIWLQQIMTTNPTLSTKQLQSHCYNKIKSGGITSLKEKYLGNGALLKKCTTGRTIRVRAQEKMG